MKRILFCLAAAVVASGLLAADVNRKRDVIFYHYDVVPVLWPKSLPYTPDAIIKGFDNPKRIMDGLPEKAMSAAVKPDTFVYVPMPNFANLSAVIPSNEPQLQQPTCSSWMRGTKNAMPEIKKQGKANDPVSTMSAWARKNKKEFFVGLCVNDTFLQSGYNPLKPPPPFLVDNYLFNSFKAKNLTWLMGSQKDTPPLKGLTSNYPPYANWCLMDYNQAEVRAKFVAIAKEIISGYDIDGVMIDFCRQPRLFRSVAWGGSASASQCLLITEMLGQISAAAKAKGCLVAVRVPDSLQVCKEAGMDVPAWFAQKFADLLFVGGTCELNRWSVASEMAQKCGVPFYASIDQARIYATNDEGTREDDQRMPRQTPEVYRARVSEARIAGAKGIMYSSGREEWWDSWWNYTDPKLFQPEQDKIRLENKRYFVNYRTRTGEFVKDMRKYAPIQSQALTTFSPKEIKGNAKYEIYVWDDFETLKKERVRTKCYLTTIIEIPSGWTVDVNINGKPLKVLKKRAGSQIYEIPAGVTKFGKNEILLSVKGGNRRGLVPRIGNMGIDVVFNGELEALKKPGNVMVPVKEISKKGGAAEKAAKPVKKGGRK
jgi:hypothetical protein